jgi:hypothetical protein
VEKLIGHIIYNFHKQVCLCVYIYIFFFLRYNHDCQLCVAKLIRIEVQSHASDGTIQMKLHQLSPILIPIHMIKKGTKL